MVQVFDKFGAEQSAAWLEEEFGPVTRLVAAAGPGYRLVVLRERDDLPGTEADATVVVRVRNADGTPAQGVEVARSWPDDTLPRLPDRLATWWLRGVFGKTNQNGDIGFGMGRGDYYWPPTQGASEVWVAGGDGVAGLGMIGGTNHRHLDVEFRWDDGEDPPPDPPPPPPPPDPGLRFFDESGQERDLDWAVEQFGAQGVHRPLVDWAYRLRRLSAESGEERVLKVQVLDMDGQPLVGVSVAMVPVDVGGVGTVTALTDGGGLAVFEMADAHGYNVAEGAHFGGVVTAGHSDVNNRCGWVRAKGFPPRWLNMVFVYESEPPAPGPDLDAVRAAVSVAQDALNEAARLLEAGGE